MEARKKAKKELIMERFVIEGGHRLSGTVKVSGNKNAALKLLPACLLSDEPVVLHNIPKLPTRYSPVRHYHQKVLVRKLELLKSRPTCMPNPRRQRSF